MTAFTDDPFVELCWTKLNGDIHKACFPESAAKIMMHKHLLPQQDAGIIRDVGIKQIN
jgi:hypothetical protein